MLQAKHAADRRHNSWSEGGWWGGSNRCSPWGAKGLSGVARVSSKQYVAPHVGPKASHHRHWRSIRVMGQAVGMKWKEAWGQLGRWLIDPWTCLHGCMSGVWEEWHCCQSQVAQEVYRQLISPAGVRCEPACPDVGSSHVVLIIINAILWMLSVLCLIWPLCSKTTLPSLTYLPEFNFSLNIMHTPCIIKIKLKKVCSHICYNQMYSIVSWHLRTLTLEDKFKSNL